MLQTIERDNQILLDNNNNPLFCNVLGFVASTVGEPLVIYHDGNGGVATVYDNKADECTTCCFATSDTDFVDEVLNTLQGDITCCGLTTPLFEHISARHEVLWTSKCGLFRHNGEDIDVDITYDMASLDPVYWQMVSDGTPYKPLEADVVECITHRPSSAIYVNGKPVCWVLLHKEYSLGMLYTVPEYRNQGMALQVMADLCNKVIDMGMVPYGYIVKGNLASERLAKKYNLEYQYDATWCGMDIKRR